MKMLCTNPANVPLHRSYNADIMPRQIRRTMVPSSLKNKFMTTTPSSQKREK